MNSQTINQTFNLLALAENDTRLKRAGNFYIGPCPFCGGRDRFNLKQTQEGWRWFCRKCGDDKYRTAIDYVMRRESLDFKESLKLMGGTTSMPNRPMIAPTPAPPEIILPDSEWQTQRWREIDQACHALEHGATAKIAREYLQSRALSPSIWSVYLLGYEVVYNRPAIVIPWFDEAETLVAIKYRFIDGLAKREKGRRFGMAKGSVPILFGLQTAALKDTLVLCEGEINSMSVVQVAMNELLGVDSLSFGTESMGYRDVVRAAAHEYERVILWADNPAKAKAVRSSLARSVDAICSPEIDGVKYDANALLQKGYLTEFLRETLKDSNM